MLEEFRKKSKKMICGKKAKVKAKEKKKHQLKIITAVTRLKKLIDDSNEAQLMDMLSDVTIQ